MNSRYSSSVVAPIRRSSPRASMGLSMLEAATSPRPARAHQDVQLVDEGDDLSLGLGDLLEHGLEALLELTAVHGAGDERGDVEGDELFALEALGDVARDDALGEAFDDGGLADAGLADEDGVVLGAPGEHLADAADLAVAADDRVELAGRASSVRLIPNCSRALRWSSCPGCCVAFMCLLKSAASALHKT